MRQGRGPDGQAFSETTVNPAGLPAWYYLQLGREDSEKLITDRAVDGCFLVRASESKKGAAVLSIYAENKEGRSGGMIHHYYIESKNGVLTLQVCQAAHRTGYPSYPNSSQYGLWVPCLLRLYHSARS